MQPRRMRHREAAGDQLLPGDVDDAAVADARLAPGARRIGLCGDRDEARAAVLHCHPVEVAAVLGPQRADEARLPDGPKAAPLIDRGEAGKEGIDENRTV